MNETREVKNGGLNGPTTYYWVDGRELGQYDGIRGNMKAYSTRSSVSDYFNTAVECETWLREVAEANDAFRDMDHDERDAYCNAPPAVQKQLVAEWRARQ